MDTNQQLIRSYVANGSEGAFRELVERHINLVYSAALRESTGNVAEAEDLTQSVFTELARRASDLIEHPSLGGWLYTCVRRMSANARRSEERRQRREQEVFTMNQILGPDPADNLWQQVRPELDDVMHELREEERNAVVMRFFEGASHKEVGAALGLSENAARMKIDRALEKLRELLSRRGIKSTASSLAGILAGAAVTSAPSSLAGGVAAGALSVVGSSPSVMSALLKVLRAGKGVPTAACALLLLSTLWTAWHPIGRSRAATEQSFAAATAPSENRLGQSAAQSGGGGLNGAAWDPRGLQQMMLQVVDGETSQPLPDTKLHLFYLRQDGRGETVKQITDAQGKCGIDGLQAPFHGLNLFVTADRHVPKVTTWGFGRAMPAEYT